MTNDAKLPPVPSADLSHILSNAAADFQALSGCRLFITGGTGFFGTWLLEALAAANDQLDCKISAVVLSRDPNTFSKRSPHLFSHPAFTWWKGDIRSFAPPPGTIDHIIHGATSASAALNVQDPREMFSTIVEGTRHVLEFAKNNGVTSQLLISSGAVYGKQPEDLANTPETYLGAPTPNDPQSAYAEGKRAAEMLCALTPECSTKIARCFAFIGPHLPLDAHFAAGNFMRDALLGVPIIIQGDGRPVRSYLHAADLVIWLLAILVRGKNQRPYNVGSDESISIAELAKMIALRVERPVDIRILAATGYGLPPRYVPSIDRAREELGLRVKMPLNMALKSTLSWWAK